MNNCILLWGKRVTASLNDGSGMLSLPLRSVVHGLFCFLELNSSDLILLAHLFSLLCNSMMINVKVKLSA
jgi:hypothetical protein